MTPAGTTFAPTRRKPRPRRSTWVAGCLLSALVMVAGCSGIPGSGPVQDVSRIADQPSAAVPAGPVAGQPPADIVRGFVQATGRIGAPGPVGSTYGAAKQFLTKSAQASWLSKPYPVVILSDQFRTDSAPTDSTAVSISGTSRGSLDLDRAFHAGNGTVYSHVVHLVREDGEWRITDPPDALLIRESDFADTFSSRTLYYLDAGRTNVVPDLRFLRAGGSQDDTLASSLVSLLLKGPAGVLKGAAQSQLAGGALRSNVVTDDAGITHVDLQHIKLPTPAARRALAAQVVWTLYPDAQVAITVDGEPLEPPSGVPAGDSAGRLPADQAVYSLKSVLSFSPDRVPGTGAAQSDPYYIDESGAIRSLLDNQPMWGRVGNRSVRVLSAAMSAATGTLAAVSRTSDGAQELLIGRPLEKQQAVSALKAGTLTLPSFSRTGDEVWVVQNGGTKPEIYRISTAQAVSGPASRAKVGAAQLAGRGPVTALALAPDGVRVAIVAGAKLYLGAVVPPAPPAGGDPASAGGDNPDALSIINLTEIQPDLVGVGPVTFRSSTQLLVASLSVTSRIRSINDVRIDGGDVKPTTTNQLFGDVEAIAVSITDANADVAGVNGTPGGGTPTSTGAGGPTQAAPTIAPGRSAAASSVYITFQNRVLKLTGSLAGGQWVDAAGAILTGSAPFFPN